MGSFVIGRFTGQLMTKAALDYGRAAGAALVNMYMVRVEATDPDAAADTIRVTVAVTAADEKGMVTLPEMRPLAGAAG